MNFDVISADKALKRKNNNSSWQAAIKKFETSLEIESDTSFKLQTGATVFTIGSCFARNIEEHLSLLGCDIPTLQFSVPRSEWKGLRANGILNKYTPASIYQDIAWAEAIYAKGDNFSNQDAEVFMYRLGNGSVIDLQLGGYNPTSEERFYERRKEIYELTRKVFSAHCVTLTLGLVETWKLGDLFVQQPPAHKGMLKDAARFDFKVLTYDECLNFIQNTIDLIRKHNPEANFLLTTSPVPLERTFTEQNCLIANMTSKSTLRTVSASIADKNARLDYFPSYEIVTMPGFRESFDEDMRHVRDNIVGKIAAQLTRNYFLDVEDTEQLVQLCAIELEGKGENDFIFKELCKSQKNRIAKLNSMQLVIYLRSCWRTKERRLARKAAKEMIKRPLRDHRSLRAVAHIFPRIGMEKQCKAYAKDVLDLDPSNDLAQRILNNPTAN